MDQVRCSMCDSKVNEIRSDRAPTFKAIALQMTKNLNSFSFALRYYSLCDLSHLINGQK